MQKKKLDTKARDWEPHFDVAPLANSALPDRALRMVYDSRRAEQLAAHRRWITIVFVVGAIFFLGSLAGLKFDVATSLQGERFLALLAVSGMALLVAGVLLGWQTLATEQHLHRLSMMRLKLDSFEATVEAMRLRTRIAMGREECERLPEPRGSRLAMEVLTALMLLEEENARGKSDKKTEDLAARLISAGMRESVLRRFVNADGPASDDVWRESAQNRRMPA